MSMREIKIPLGLLDVWLTEVSLTHNQTRFLMSEFTRQAHPDAAHRDRLSKEILA